MEEDIVKVKDLIAALQQFDPEMVVHLDKDGWDEQYCAKYQETKDPKDLIYWRGIWAQYGSSLCINN